MLGEGDRCAMDYHRLVVRHRRWRPILTLYRNDVIDDDPRVIATRKDPVDVLTADVSNVLEGSPRLTIVQTTANES